MPGVILGTWSSLYATGTYLAAVDSAWAVPLNTFLLLLTAMIGYVLNRKVGAVGDQVGEVDKKAQAIHEDVTQTASAAASAAAAAEAAARITKEIGGAVRHVDTSTVAPATDATDATGGGEGV